MKEIFVSNSLELYGLTIRTKNLDELDTATAKIGPVWDKFFSNIAPLLKEGAKVYGVYSNYESDASGEFDLTACTDQEISNVSSITLKSGKYLIFSASGDMPKVVIDTWGTIWNYFGKENTKYERTYLTDYECYKSNHEIEIYIGIK